MFKIVGLALMVAVAAPAMAADAPATDSAAAKPEKRERRICKRETTSDSLIKKKRTCLTEQEWKQAEFYNSQTVKKWQDVVDSSRRGN